MRLVLATIGFVSVFIAPWWITALAALPLALRWRSWEVVAMGFLMDTLWLSETFWWGIPWATLIAVAFVWILEPIRNELLVDQPAL